MISITRLLCGSEYYGDSLRYRPGAGKEIHGTSPGSGPVVIWNITQSCNLKCKHCYANSESKKYEGELSPKEGLKLVDDLAAFKVPVILFSGGEPLIREDFFDLASRAAKLGIRATISTNGTLITPDTARSIKKVGISYVGISLDGLGELNDRFRGSQGAFDQALQGIRACREAGQKVGLRFTINRHNFNQIEDILYLVKEEKIPRVCFYHLVYTGRGKEMIKEDISHEETREVLDLLMEKTKEFHQKGQEKEILTVDNHADGPYIYMKMKEKDPEKAQEILELITINGGNRSGMAVGSINSLGDVYPDQFTRTHKLGSVKERSFKEIWTNEDNEFLRKLRDRKPLLKGRCSSCRWLDMCNGNFRARAEAFTGDYWETDPACFLTDEEIRAD
ncbi:putative heme d1 biosynthesis radical SAM protein NirJ1 [Candidatus Contubernalis alkaliaceticus]|uniref:putative heme d1 biosynthesis radical SAM protein NirJ1 n=1 Tax=Candidatus Contubernalis alkaliaceticus TaxID=338645 RepID=UPI001F4BD6F5|nr:putative heme d1 biosynthesis radical SAM protein NirJ1 [Candidatus Contubernalis alkalaceticus]UNC92949.1 putative heme d1 biosynthesis radical SAM protein NirJ1 [Candidatus Contubernalis alkalaceticus]